MARRTPSRTTAFEHVQRTWGKDPTSRRVAVSSVASLESVLGTGVKPDPLGGVRLVILRTGAQQGLQADLAFRRTPRLETRIVLGGAVFRVLLLDRRAALEKTTARFGSEHRCKRLFRETPLFGEFQQLLGVGFFVNDGSRHRVPPRRVNAISIPMQRASGCATSHDSVARLPDFRQAVGRPGAFPAHTYADVTTLSW